MTSVDITALRLLGKHGLSKAVIEAQQCYYLCKPNKKKYWEMVIEYLKSI